MYLLEQIIKVYHHKKDFVLHSNSKPRPTLEHFVKEVVNNIKD